MNSEPTIQAKIEKKPYAKPEVVSHGSVEKLTQIAVGGDCGCSSHPIELPSFPIFN